MNYQLNKTSHLVTVSSEENLQDFKKKLFSEGFYLGFYPLGSSDKSIKYYLDRRVPNLYHFRYGSLAEQVSSAEILLPHGEEFHLKDAPRAAIGPDFNRMIIGSRGALGQFKKVTLKIVALPEKVVHGVIPVLDKDQARHIISQMVGRFLPPLYFRYFDNETATPFMEELKIKNKLDEALLLCLSGLPSMVNAYQKIIEALSQEMGLNCHWPDKKTSLDVINTHVHNTESYSCIRDQYRQFLWTASESSGQSLWEKDFLK